jgi:RNA polymerase sigma-70 factor (ECF subfamily)
VLEPDPVTIRRAAEGDVDAFEVLVRQYQDPLLRFLCREVGDRSLAEDLAQETFLRAFRRMRSFRFEAKFSTWLFQIAHNAAVDAHRAAGRRARTLRSLPPVSGTVGDRGGASAELDAALAALRPIERSALLAVEVLGFTYRDAATMLGVAEGTVKRRVFDARRRLVDWAIASEREASGDV